ncbi:unnamed protein product [Dracunculus medinensis]|uniref:G_PROTEIN_RECEP_F1_2 domain-containing protein n=1 Tax=Dracunculus medinensis TaxID=318479 RepID=A0A3P7Q2Z2_DRAME|nr:unnamed protein product [Dracunculus medinensis]
MVYEMLTYILFIFEGSILTIFNSYMLLNVIIKKLNRQQYKSFISCFAFDILFGLTYISIGTYRIIIIPDKLTSRFDCLMNIHGWLMVGVFPLSGLLVLAVAMDRTFFILSFYIGKM